MFILTIYFFFIIGFVFEIISPVLEVGYFILAVITDFILAKTREHLGGKLQAYYIFLVGTAIILGFFNVIGLLPYTTALTGQFIFAFYFSIVYFVVNLIIGVLYHKNKIFNLFLPKGVPLFIVPALILIEAISFFSRVLSLAIRLFANIVAGHILLKILVSFLNVILTAHLSFGFPSIIAVIGILIIAVLEVFISILQVYIFNLLLLIYINGVLDLH
jgi:F-type H+-transporting ATPase subunit a